jgi:YVTN family beta-propeller protein
VRPNSVGVIDARRNVVIDQIPVGSRPGPTVSGGHSVWVANVGDRTIARIDPGTGTVKRYIPLQATPTGLAFAGPYLWIAYGLLGSVGRVNASFNEAEDPLDAGVGVARTAAVAVGFDSVWFVSGNAKIARLDPDSMRATAPLLIAGTSPSGVAVDSTAVWVSNQGDNNVYEISPATNESIWAPSVSSGPTAIATGAGAVWVANGGSDSVTRIDPVGRSTFTIRVGVQPTAIAYGAGSVWVANGNDGTVWRIDPSSNVAIKKIHVGNRPSGLAVSNGRVYVTVQAP